MTLEFIDTCLNKKIAENQEIIVYTYYELRIKNNLSKIEANSFLELTKTKLENLNYRVYATGENYIYENKAKTVRENELLVAIKNT